MKLPFFLARRFVAGESLQEALPVIDQLRSQGLKVTLDLLGEDVQERSRASSYTDEYIALIERLAAHGGTPEPNISIKLSMIGQRIDHGSCLANLRRLLGAARPVGGFVRLDMEGSDLTQSTLDLFEEVYPEFRDHVGVVLQSYLHRTDMDVERMIELQARVRLCKGAYKEPPSIAYQDMSSIRRQFVKQTERLLLYGRYPAIATHDDILIRSVRNFVAEQNLTSERFEFQMLYGIRPETQLAIAQAGFNMRVYVPYGTEWGPYFARRLRERKENVWFVLKNLLRR
jgi:proline dehydrogenase